MVEWDSKNVVKWVAHTQKYLWWLLFLVIKVEPSSQDYEVFPPTGERTMVADCQSSNRREGDTSIYNSYPQLNTNSSQ